MKKIIMGVTLIFSVFLFACQDNKIELETESETMILLEEEKHLESKDKWDEYQESLELTMWTFHGQVMTEGEMPTVLANENSAMMQFSVDAFNYDPNYYVYIYINDILVEKAQYSNISTSVNITEDFLKEGDYTIRFVQYETNEEDGNVISEKIARYKVEW